MGSGLWEHEGFAGWRWVGAVQRGQKQQARAVPPGSVRLGRLDGGGPWEPSGERRVRRSARTFFAGCSAVTPEGLAFCQTHNHQSAKCVQLRI